MSSSECFKQPSTAPELSGGLQVQEVVRSLLRTRPAVMVKCNDGLHYIVHQPGSSLGGTALAASLLGPAIAQSMGFTIASSCPVAVDDYMAARQREAPSFPEERVLTQAGLYSASRLAGSVSGDDWAVPFVSPSRWPSIVNRADLLGMQLLQTWAGSGQVPKAMFRRMEDRRSLLVVFVGVNQLLANVASEPSLAPLVFFGSSGAAQGGASTHEALRAWFMKLREAAHFAMAVTFPALASEWPSLDLSSLHAPLVSRLKQMETRMNIAPRTH